MKVLKHYETKGGKYGIKAILQEDNTVNVEEFKHDKSCGCCCGRSYLQRIFKFKEKVV